MKSMTAAAGLSSLLLLLSACSTGTRYDDLEPFQSPLSFTLVRDVRPEGFLYQAYVQTTDGHSGSKQLVAAVHRSGTEIFIRLYGIRPCRVCTRDISHLGTYLDLGYLTEGNYEVLADVRGAKSTAQLEIDDHWVRLLPPLHPQIVQTDIAIGHPPEDGVVLVSWSRDPVREPLVAALRDSIEAAGAIPAEFTRDPSGFYRFPLDGSGVEWITRGFARMPFEEQNVLAVLGLPRGSRGVTESSNGIAFLFRMSGDHVPLASLVDRVASAAVVEGHVQYEVLSFRGWAHRGTVAPTTP